MRSYPTTDLEHAGHIARVADLNRRIGNQIPDKPLGTEEAPEKMRRTLATLILKEALETVAGLGFQANVMPNPDTLMHYTDKVHMVNLEPHGGGYSATETADGCADVSVCVIGALLRLGINPTPILRAVDFANLRKFEPVYVADVTAAGGKRKATREECKAQGLGGYLEWEGPDAGKWIKPASWQDVMPEVMQLLVNMQLNGSW